MTNFPGVGGKLWDEDTMDFSLKVNDFCIKTFAHIDAA